MQPVCAAKDFLKKETLKKYLAVLAVLFAAVSLLEVFLFNYRHFESRRWESIDLLEHSVFEMQGFRKNHGSSSFTVSTDNEGEFSVAFSNLDVELRNLHVSAYPADIPLSVNISYTDSGNALPTQPQQRTMLSAVPQSGYARIHTAGKTELLLLSFSMPGQLEFEIKSLEINTTVPFSFSFIRVGILFIILFAIYCLRPSSAIYRLKAVGINNRLMKCAIVVFILLLQISVFRVLTTANTFWVKAERPYDSQYHRVTESLANGQLHLQEEPPQWLLEAENPYDLGMRIKLEEETGEIVLWDHAFYEGKYYSYFGILPAVVYYFPFFLITGTHAPNYFGIFIVLAIFSVFAMLLLYAVVKRWFRETPFALMMLLYILFVNTCGSIYNAHRPDFYNFPILLALTLVVGGLYFWVSAKKEDGTLCFIRLAIGALMMALTALSRPQFLLACFLAIPLFFEDIFNKRRLFSKKSVLHTLSLLIPFLLIGGVAMWLNAVRFSSPFDFGANYNLTSNDMTVRGFVPERIPLGLFCQLLQPPVVDAIFPYLHLTETATNYIGVTIIEPMLGGLFSVNLFAALSFGIFFFKKLFDDRKTEWRLAVTAFTFAVIVIIADTQMAGILQRYQPDFAWYFLLCSIFLSLTMFDRFRQKKALRYFIFALNMIVLVSLTYQFFLVFSDHIYSLDVTDPVKFHRVRVLFEFLN